MTGDDGTLYFQFSSPFTQDFYQLQGGLSEFLINEPLPTGHYTSITLYFDALPGTEDSNITNIDGNTYPLVIPNGAPTTFSVPVNFIVFRSISASYTIDLDLRKSIFPESQQPQPIYPATSITRHKQ